MYYYVCMYLVFRFWKFQLRSVLNLYTINPFQWSRTLFGHFLTEKYILHVEKLYLDKDSLNKCTSSKKDFSNALIVIQYFLMNWYCFQYKHSFRCSICNENFRMNDTKEKSKKATRKSFALWTPYKNFVWLWKQNTDRELPKTFFAVKLMLQRLHLLAFEREFCIPKPCY